jgi:hypothetical protein
MKKSFTLGAVSGISALAIAFPVIAQIAGAQSSASGVDQAKPNFAERPGFHGERAPLSQEDVQAMIDKDNAFLLNVDAFVAIQKETIQAHRIALEAAADIEDEIERNAAVKAAHEAMRASIEAAVEANPELKTAMMPFGHGGPGKHGKGEKMRGHLEDKLGMTEDELKAALDAGKTIEEIAEEKGITLPARPAFGGMRR